MQSTPSRQQSSWPVPPGRRTTLEDLYFKTSAADTLLVAARRLRTYLTSEKDPRPESFAAVFKERTEISRVEYDHLLSQRLENSGKVSGVFELDFDKDTFSAVSTMDGWHTYRLHDVSVAAYHAFRKQNISTDQRWDKLLDKLDGKELTPDAQATVLSGNRRLPMGKVTFQDEISECGSLLNFYVPVNFDPDEVFGTDVTSTANDDYLNVYADFDLDTGEVCDALTVIHVRGDGSEEAYRYPLDEEERAVLRTKMDAYCAEQTGMHLDEYRAQHLAEMDIKTDDRRTADNCRAQILHFNNELLRPIYHTKEEFVEVLAKIDDYERYCEEHPEYPNNRAVLAIENIREVYKERLKKRDFLQESQPRMDEDFPRS